jgi:hypothetical protein
MPQLLRPGEAAARKGCSKKAIRRACEQEKLNYEYDPVTGEYSVYDDDKLAAWRPGASSSPRGAVTPEAE